MEILRTGYVHPGRRPSRVLVETDDLSAGRLWERFVETAINREVDVAALIGGVIDSENQMYEQSDVFWSAASIFSPKEV